MADIIDFRGNDLSADEMEAVAETAVTAISKATGAVQDFMQGANGKMPEVVQAIVTNAVMTNCRTFCII